MSITERAPPCIGERSASPIAHIGQMMRYYLDATFAALFLVLLAPLICMAAAAVYFESGRPIIFCQRRTGKNGKTFKIYKFRTMSVQEDGGEVTQAKSSDERITGVGRWLRRTSIDELPQLYNVIKGEMAIVGPRPHAVAHDNYYGKRIPRYLMRQQVKPGITGLAQVSGARGGTPQLSDMERRIELDLLYIQNRGFALDLKILLFTVLAVCRDDNVF